MVKKDEIIQTIDEIVIQLLENKVWDLGAYGVSAGKLLLLAYWSEYTQNERIKGYYENYLDECLDNLQKGYDRISFINGMSGTFFSIYHLNSMGFANVDLSDIDIYYDSYLQKQMFKIWKKGNFDLLYGGIGIGLYFLQKSKNIILFEQILDYLERISIKDGDSLKWLAEGYGSPKLTISLAHGMASIILFLSYIYQSEICQEKAGTLLRKAIIQVQKHRLSFDEHGSFYPAFSKNEPRKSRLAWCYGDLGIALSLWKAGKCLESKELCGEAIDIFETDAQRVELQDNYVIDGCLCHGTAGIAQIYRRMFYETGNTVFYDISDYWIGETLKMAKFPDGVAGYKFMHETEMEVDFSLLNGVAGIGLALLSSIASEKFSNWDTSLLLSFY